MGLTAVGGLFQEEDFADHDEDFGGAGDEGEFSFEGGVSFPQFVFFEKAPVESL